MTLSDDHTNPPPSDGAKRNAGAPVPPSAIRVMIVDDEEMMRALVRRSLEKMGFTQIYAARDGAEALPLAQSQRPDLIIADYDMPKMHGLQFLKAVRQDSTLDKTGFIMLSGAANEAVVDKADELGVNSFILKPFFPEDLKRRIEALFLELTGSAIDWTAAA